MSNHLRLFRAAVVRLLPLILLLAATAVLLFSLLRAPPPWTLDLGTAHDRHFQSGFRMPVQEGATTFRWSMPQAQLVLPAIGGRLVSLRMHGDQFALDNQHRLQLERYGVNLATLEIQSGWRVYQVLLPEATARDVARGVSPLNLVSTAYPLASPGDRAPGVPIDWVRVASLPGDAAPVRAPLRQTVLVIWALAILAWGGVRLTGVGFLDGCRCDGIRRDRLLPVRANVFGIRMPCGRTEARPYGKNLHVKGFGRLLHALWPQISHGHRLFWISGSVGIVALGVLSWAAHDPYTFTWAWPAQPWFLGLATLLLGGQYVYERSGRISLGHSIWTTRCAPVRANNYSPLPPLGNAPVVSGKSRFLRGATHAIPRIVGLVALVLLAHLVLVLPLPAYWRGMAALLLLGLPGALLALLVFRHERDALLRLFLGICGSLALFPLLLLALQALPGPLSWSMLLPCNGLTVWLGWLLLRQSSPEPAPPCPERHAYVPLLAILLLGGMLRLTTLAVTEFQGDETRALLRTVGVVHGQEEILLLHKKGPIELLLPAGPLAVTGQLSEGIARMPFALAGMGVLLGTYLLSRTMLSDHPGDSGWSKATIAGLIAATILALDGFLIGFARIVQYQSVVMLMMIGALWCGWRFYTGGPYAQRYLIGAAGLTAVGLLAHYDGIFVVPALVWLVLAGGWRRGWRGMQWVRQLAGAILIGAGLLASFYLPFVLHENFRDITATYLSQRLDRQVGTAVETAMGTALRDYYRLASFYNTIYQMNWLALMLATGLIIWLWRYGRPRLLRGVLIGSLLVACAIQVWLPDHAGWAGLFFALPLAGLILFPATPPMLRTLLIWFSAAFLAESFLIADPRTHFYTMFGAAALLIGLTTVEILAWLRQQRMIWPQILVVFSGVAVVLLAVPHAYLAFVRLTPEYYRSFPAVLPDVYRTGNGDLLPTQHGYFGFPQQDGWKVISALYQQGIVQGDYDSNQKDVITAWYTHGAFRCKVTPDYFFVALREGEVDSLIQAQIWQAYQLSGYVLVDGVRTLDIYSRQPVAHAPQVFALEDYQDRVDALPIAHIPLQRTLLVDAPQYQFNARWQNGVYLRGYDLPQQQMPAGQSVYLTLYWQVAEGTQTPFVEVLDRNGNVVATGEPHCHTAPEDWGVQYVTGTTFKLTASDAMPPGVYTLRVGLHQGESGVMLPLEDGTDMLLLTHISITPP